MASEIKAVIFDLGGTLIYSDEVWPDLMQTAMRELLSYLQDQGLPLKEDGFLKEFHARLQDYYVQRDAEFVEYTTAHVLRTLLADMEQPALTEEQMNTALRQLYAVSQAHWQPEEDALPTLDQLQAAGYRMAIISNASDDADVQTLVDKAGLRGYMDFVLSSAACGIRKPNPLIFQTGLDEWGLAPAQVAMVGDTLGADILGARNAGLYSIWITRRADKAANRDHDETIQPDAVIATLAELPGLLSNR
ncbi:MAG: HAD family hydrolase [Anaerolineales bacterium]|nr:HAD family hydrolase [Anaerolineales bacterium]MCW5855197.1 HAD family hydrolase [Anaerolineales bacterium]